MERVWPHVFNFSQTHSADVPSPVHPCFVSMSNQPFESHVRGSLTRQSHACIYVYFTKETKCRTSSPTLYITITKMQSRQHFFYKKAELCDMSFSLWFHVLTTTILSELRSVDATKTQHLAAVFLTVHDDIAGDTEAGLHQWGLLFTSPRPGAPGPGLWVGLDHQRLLTLPPLLLFKQCPLWSEHRSSNDEEIHYVSVVSNCAIKGQEYTGLHAI